MHWLGEPEDLDEESLLTDKEYPSTQYTTRRSVPCKYRCESTMITKLLFPPVRYIVLASVCVVILACSSSAAFVYDVWHQLTHSQRYLQHNRIACVVRCIPCVYLHTNEFSHCYYRASVIILFGPVISLQWILGVPVLRDHIVYVRYYIRCLPDVAPHILVQCRLLHGYFL
jgi:hypothetical protein